MVLTSDEGWNVDPTAMAAVNGSATKRRARITRAIAGAKR
jgi:hypothetical protein